MPSKRTWLFVAAAVLLLWLRPWQRLARQLRGAPGSADVLHPEAAFTGGQAAPGAAAAEPVGAILDRGAATIERAASDQAAALGAADPAADGAEFAGPAFFGTREPAAETGAEPDLIDALLADEEEPDADAIMALDDELDAAAALDAIEPEQAETLSAAPIAEQGAQAEAELEASEVGAEEPRRPDDLLVIEGIGPRTSTIVTAAGYTSFAQLAAADVEALRAALTDAGIRTVDPTTWPEQAQLAADGRWDELKELQGRIKNGRKTG